MNLRTRVFKIVIPILSILLSFIIGAVMIVAIGGNPAEAYYYLFRGVFGSSANIAESFVKATPLIFTGLAAAFAYRCGVFNLGAEGQFVMGALATMIVSDRFASLPAGLLTVLSIVAGIVAGGIWGLIPGILKIWRGLNEMIVSIMLNYIATLFMGYLYSGPMRDGNLPQTAAIPYKLPRLFGQSRLNIGIIIAVVVGLLVYYFMFYTAKGLQMRAVGMNPEASGVNGFSVRKIMLFSFVISGAIAGLGGSIELLGTQYRLMSGFGNGYGFDGVAIALIGQLNPIGTMLVAYLFAILRTGATTMQVGTGLPTSVIDIIQALVIIFAVAGSAYMNLPKIRQFFTDRNPKKQEEKKAS